MERIGSFNGYIQSITYIQPSSSIIVYKYLALIFPVLFKLPTYALINHTIIKVTTYHD